MLVALSAGAQHTHSNRIVEQFVFSGRRGHAIFDCDWSSDVCSSDLIANQLVEFHGGTITASSEGEGKGATFTIELPLPAAHPTTETPIPSTETAAPEKIDLNGLRVLRSEERRVGKEWRSRWSPDH